MIPLSLLVTAFGLGLAYAAAPGAVNTEALRRGIARGARSTLLVETGSLIGDSLWALLALTGVTLLTRYLAVHIVLGFVGGFFLLRLAWLACSEALVRRHASQGSPSPSRGDFVTGVIFGLANPAGFAFWSGLGSGVVASGATGWQFACFFAGFFFGAVLWCIGISAAILWGRRRMHPSLSTWVHALCGLVLGYFGLHVLWVTLQDWQQIWPALPSTH
jgi:chemosensory pili system protein ChpE